jgi:iron complex transport system permease protein
LSVLVLIFLALFSLGIGSKSISFNEIIAALSNSISEKTTSSIIVWQLRIPRTTAAILAGSALSVGGLTMQTLFKNPLVGPSVLGVNAGASMGAALILLASEKLGLAFLKNSGFGVLLASCLGSAGVLIGILFLSKYVGRLTLLVIGILIAQFISSLTGILINFSSPEQVQAFALWNLGTFTDLNIARIKIIFPFFIVGIICAISQTKNLNAWLLGVNYAKSLGIAVNRSRAILIISASILSGVITSFCGPITFLGMAVPHLSRALHCSSDHRILIPSTLILGPCVALIADLSARLPGSHHALPINPVLALIGAPVVISVVLKTHRMRDSL